MLIEAFELLRSLTQNGIELPITHPRIQLPGKGNGRRVRVRLGSLGEVTAVEDLADDEWDGVWAIMRTSDPSFPVMRMKQALAFYAKDDSVWTELQEARRRRDYRARFELLKRELAKWSLDCNAIAKTLAELATIRKSKATELANVFAGDSSCPVLAEIATRFLKAEADGAKFLQSIIHFSLDALSKAQLNDIEAVELMFFGKKPGADGSAPAIQVQIALDVDAAELSMQDLYSARTRNYVKTVLPLSPTAEGSNSKVGRCAITGRTVKIQSDAFPPVRLPVVAERGLSIFSMKRDAGCNHRYGASESDLIPVGRAEVVELAAALDWVTNRTLRRGKTWRSTASGSFERRDDRTTEKFDLLIAYVDGKPDIDAAVADIFGTETTVVGNQFEADAKTVVDALDGIARERPNSKLHILVLRKVSEGQVQVVLSESVTIQRIIDGAEWWQRAARNSPQLTIPLPIEKGKPALQTSPPIPYPDQLVRALSREWIRGGTHAVEVCSLSIGQVLDLMLQSEGKWQPVARNVIRLGLSRLWALHIGLTGALRTHDERRLKDAKGNDLFPVHAREKALIGISLLGIGLYALGSEKESYMNESSYLVGRMLAMADDLHQSYCVVVRSGSIPPSLLGNSLMASALDNPVKAVAVLAARIRVYVGWAKIARLPDPSNQGEAAEKERIAVKTARRRLQQYGTLAQQLETAGMPGGMTDEARAHLLLGYLASTRDTDAPQGAKEDSGDE